MRLCQSQGNQYRHKLGNYSIKFLLKYAWQAFRPGIIMAYASVVASFNVNGYQKAFRTLQLLVFHLYIH